MICWIKIELAVSQRMANGKVLVRFCFGILCVGVLVATLVVLLNLLGFNGSRTHNTERKDTYPVELLFFKEEEGDISFAVGYRGDEIQFLFAVDEDKNGRLFVSPAERANTYLPPYRIAREVAVRHVRIVYDALSSKTEHIEFTYKKFEKSNVLYVEEAIIHLHESRRGIIEELF